MKTEDAADGMPSLLFILTEAQRNFSRELFPAFPLTYEEIKEDCDRMISSLARQYTDKSCVELHEEELVGEGNRKLSECLSQGILREFAGRRSELFKWIRACVNNHIRGLVHKYRFTFKRTGQRPPVRGAVSWEPRPKPEVSLDDPDACVHLPHQYTLHGFPALKTDMRELLTPIEFLVFKQLIEPNEAALAYATHDSYRGRRRTSSVELRITTEHLAHGLGLPSAQFTVVQGQIQEKVKAYMNDPIPSDSPRHAAITALERIFKLHIPRSVEPVVVRRLLTLAARANYELVDEKVAALLDAAGARVPKQDTSGNLTCFGVLFQRDNRICVSCGVHESCAVEAANYGLGDVALSPKLLGARMLMRIPTFTDTPPTFMPKSTPTPPPPQQTPEPTRPPESAVPPAAAETPKPPGRIYHKAMPQDSREDELEAYLYAHFHDILFSGDLYFRHRVSRPDGKVRHCFWLGRVDGLEGGHWALRFCKPSDAIKPQLLEHRVSHYLPPSMPVDQAIKLINQHADETYRTS